MARAVVNLSALEGSVKGRLVLEQASFDAPTSVVGEVSGLSPGRHALSVTMFGDLASAEGLGLHFNPHSKNHGAQGWLVYFFIDLCCCCCSLTAGRVVRQYDQRLI